MDYYVICDYASECTKSAGCQYYTKYPGGSTIDHGWCNQSNRHVNIVEYVDLDEDNPNMKFKRKYGH